MNLSDFISKENIPSVDGVPYEKSNEELLKEKLEDLIFTTKDIPQLIEDSDKIVFVNWTSSISVVDKWDKKKKKNQRKFLICRFLEVNNYDPIGHDFEAKDETEAIEYIIESYCFQNFLKYNKLIFDGRYLLNFNFERMIYLDGRVQKLSSD